MKPYALLTFAALCTASLATGQSERIEEAHAKSNETIKHKLIDTTQNNHASPHAKEYKFKNGEVVVIDKDEAGNTTEITYHKKKKKVQPIRWGLGFDLGFNSYSSNNFITGTDGKDDFLDLHTSRSINFTLYPVLGEFSLSKSKRLWFNTGLGFNWANYRFEDGWSITRTDGITLPSDRFRENGVSTVTKSKLTTCYMVAPILLKFRIPVGGSSRDWFYISAGVVGGVKVGSHTKVRFNTNRRRIEKEFSSFNLNMLRYEFTLRAGYRGLGVYFNYQMSPMFENGRGPKLFPYAAGINVTL